ncbi:MAG: UxaA family hydrolase, partial [Candidatus Rokubacteria bacterium]|nr:UxaA family hydrolase [Candidatus Rokubacteria bacterium]
PVDDLSNRAAEGAAALVPGAVALPHPYGRLQFGEDLALTFRTLIGAGRSPNVAAAVVIGIEPNWTRRVVEGIAETGKPAAGFSIEGHGDLKTIEMAARRAGEFQQAASELRREPVDLAELTVSIKCGESDTTTGLASNPSVGVVVDRLADMGATVLFGETSELTGGEHLVAARMATPELRQQFLDAFNAYLADIEGQGANLMGSQPTQGNIAGGLSTIEEKALGNIAKTGTRPIMGVLRPAEAPGAKRGIYFMDTSSAAAECVTLFAAAGAQVHLFTTGQGNIIGNPIVPVVKISGNPRTVATMSEHIDVDVTGLLRLEMTLPQAGDAVMAMLLRTASGRLTAAEVQGHREFVLTRLHRTA